MNIALKLIEDQRLFEFCDVYCSEIYGILEAYLMLFIIDLSEGTIVESVALLILSPRR